MAILIAHRGFRSTLGENRMIDFENALKFCLAVEFDIRLTKDNQVIIFHDDTLKRIANEDLKVKDLTFQEIINLEFFKKNPQSKPPLLNDFTMKLGKYYQTINIEIKEEPNHKYTSQELKIIFSEINIVKENTTGEIIVSSFNQEILKEIKARIFSPLKKGYLFDNKNNFNSTFAQEFDYIHPSVTSALDDKIMMQLKNSAKPLNIWTFKTDTEAKKINDAYKKQINGYISDNPKLKWVAN